MFFCGFLNTKRVGRNSKCNVKYTRTVKTTNYRRKLYFNLIRTQRRLRYTLREDKKIDYYLFSYGGNGTRMFHSFLSQYKRINSPAHCHYGAPPRNGKKPVIYLYGNPVDSVFSFYRKQEQSDPYFIEKHIENMVSPHAPLLDISEFAESGEDIFCINRHWTEFQELQYKGMIFVKYEYLWNVLPELLECLDLKENLADFPTKRERTVFLHRQDVSLKEKLSSIYAETIRMQNCMPPIYFK